MFTKAGFACSDPGLLRSTSRPPDRVLADPEQPRQLGDAALILIAQSADLGALFG